MKVSPVMIGGAIAIALIFGGVASQLFTSLYPGGWELGTNFDSAVINNVSVAPGQISSKFINGSYLNARGGYLKLNDAMSTGAQWAEYKIHPQWFGSTKVAIDVDSPYPVTRDAYGESWYKSADDEPYRVYEEWDSVTKSYTFFAHYVYFFTLDIKTDGNAELGSQGWVYGTCEGLPSMAQADHETSIRVFTQIGLQPWSVQNGQILSYNESEAEVSNVFYGIMSASVAEVEVGNMVDATEIGDNPDLNNWAYDAYWMGLAQPHKDHTGAALAMYYPDSNKSYAGFPSVAEDADVEDQVKNVVSVSTEIPQSVIIEVGADLEPGLIVSYGDWLHPGTWTDWTPVNKYVRTVARVDAVYSADLTIRTGDQDPAGDKTEDQLIDDIETMKELITEEIDKAFTELQERSTEWLNSILIPVLIIGGVILMVLVVVYLILGRFSLRGLIG